MEISEVKNTMSEIRSQQQDGNAKEWVSEY